MSSSEQNAASTACGKYRYVVSMQVSRAVAARLRPRLLLVVVVLLLLMVVMMITTMMITTGGDYYSW